MNLAILAKMGWRLVKEPEKLWAKILYVKYVRGKMKFSKLEKKKGMLQMLGSGWLYLERLSNKELGQRSTMGLKLSFGEKCVWETYHL